MGSRHEPASLSRAAPVMAALVMAALAACSSNHRAFTPEPSSPGARPLPATASSPAPAPSATEPPSLPATSGPPPLQRPDDDALIAASRPVRFQSIDGVRLSGRVFGSGITGVVLSHMLESDQEPWWWMASILAEHGFMALTYDNRGTCPGGPAGCSAGNFDPNGVAPDILGAVAYLRAHGAKRVVIGGASLGGTASLSVASKHPDAVDGVFTLSAVSFFPPYDITARLIHAIRVPKLFVAGARDASAGPYVPVWRRAATPPVRAVVLDTSTHGTDLFDDQQFSRRVREEILRFVEGS